MSIYTRDKVIVSADKATYLQRDESTGRLNFVVDDVVVGYMTSTAIVWNLDQTIVTDQVFQGDIDLGDAITDTISFIGRVDTDVVPIADSTHDLGTTALRWAQAYVDSIFSTDIDAGASGVAGSVDVFPSTASKGKFALACTDQTGDTTVTLNANAMGQATTVNLPDPGAAASYLVQADAAPSAALPLAELESVDLSRKVTFYDDFLAAAIDGRISSTAGSGTGNQVATTVSNGVNGEITLKSASDDGATSANATTLTLDQLNYKANQGGLAMEAKVKVDDITACAFYVGFTDVISTTVELAIGSSAGDTVVADADDACGIFFDTDADTDQIGVAGVKATAVTAATFSGSAPVNDTYVTLRVEVSAAGAVTGYLNGTAIGTVANAVTATVALTPCMVICNRGAAQRILTADYIWAQQDR